MKHTKGPWTLRSEIPEAGKYPAYELHIDAGRANIDTLATIWHSPLDEDTEAIADAKLIAAAPELLEALIKARDIIGENDSFEWEYFDQIIKKATI